jgi:hypothetical protein
MDHEGWRRGRLVLRALAIVGALGFLVLVMVQAMEFYAPPKPAPARRQVPPPATPVVPARRPAPLPPLDDGLLLPATKAGILGPLRRSQPAAQP